MTPAPSKSKLCRSPNGSEASWNMQAVMSRLPEGSKQTEPTNDLCGKVAMSLRDLNCQRRHVLIVRRFGGHHPKGVDGVHGGAEEAADAPKVH